MPLAGVAVVKVKEQEAQEIAGPDQTCTRLMNTRASNGVIMCELF